MFEDEPRDGSLWLLEADPALRGLSEIAALWPVLARLERQLVAEARSRWWTWREIGEAMGADRHVARRRALPDSVSRGGLQ